MSTAIVLGRRARQKHPLRHLVRVTRRWGNQVAAGLGLAPQLADRGYMICTSPRSGSSYFGQLLFSTGMLGDPREYFHIQARRKVDANYPSDPRKQLRIVLTTGATPNGIYAVKVFSPHIRVTRQRIDLFHDLPNLRLLRLHRRDLLGQAISLARARQTGQFDSRVPERQPPAYNQQNIRDCVQDLINQQAIWDKVLGRLGVEPLTFEYETIVQDPQRAVDRVAALMGVPTPVTLRLPAEVKQIQRDGLNTEWRERFLAETGDEFRHLPGPT